MANYFIFNGTNSTSINGLIVSSLPPISKPPIRAEVIETEGRDGDIVIEQGYQAYNKAIGVYLNDLTVLDSVMGWLQGEGDLLLSTEIDKYYKARVINGIDFERFVTLRKGTITFHVQPYKYSTNEANVTASAAQLTAKSVTVANQGNVTSLPLLHMTGSGTVTLSLNSNELFSYTFPNGETEVYIDSEAQDAYLDTILKNRNMNGAFVELPPGASTITWTGTLTALEITPRSRWV